MQEDLELKENLIEEDEISSLKHYRQNPPAWVSKHPHLIFNRYSSSQYYEVQILMIKLLWCGHLARINCTSLKLNLLYLMFFAKIYPILRPEELL